jgi:hypothetical protein
VATKHGLLDTVKALISHGADVNAVAKDDVMSLTLAGSITDESRRNDMVTLLTSQ